MTKTRAQIVAGAAVSLMAAWAMPKVLGAPRGLPGRLVAAGFVYALHECMDAPLADRLARLGV
ncbi:MAG: hypothetical protein ACT4QF_09340 [Sporichthyaceae bacterium]